MENCPDDKCIKQRQKDHDDVTILKSRWKSLGYGLSTGLIILGIMMGIISKMNATAQEAASAEVVSIKTKDVEQDKEIHEIKLDVVKIKTDIEYIKDSQERQEKNDQKIIEALDKLNGKKNEQ